jgi:uncharacterized protein
MAIVALVVLPPAAAQSPDTPVMGSSATAEPPPAGEAEQMTRILVLGDDVGGGLGAGMVRMGEIDGRFDVALRFNEESGLARPEVYDWVASLPKILESSDYDVIVALIGANDRQMIRAGNARYAFNTPEWIAAYSVQMDRLLDTLKASGAKVYWVSLPPMADAEYDAAMRIISDLQRQRAEAKGVGYIDIRPQLSNPDGSYTDTGRDDTGEILAQLVLQAIQSGKAPSQAAATDNGAPASAPVPRTSVQERDVPLFGQTLMFGEVVILRPVDVTVSAMQVIRSGGDPLPPSAALAAIRAMVQPGSAAEKLFSDGVAVPAPRGRADDFTAPAIAD